MEAAMEGEARAAAMVVERVEAAKVEAVAVATAAVEKAVAAREAAWAEARAGAMGEEVTGEGPEMAEKEEWAAKVASAAADCRAKSRQRP